MLCLEVTLKISETGLHAGLLQRLIVELAPPRNPKNVADVEWDTGSNRLRYARICANLLLAPLKS
jgi:hypothetical protein